MWWQGTLQKLLNSSDISMFVDTIAYYFEDSLLRIDKMLGVVTTEQKPSVEIPILENLPVDRGLCCYSTVMTVRLESKRPLLRKVA